MGFLGKIGDFVHGITSKLTGILDKLGPFRFMLDLWPPFAIADGILHAADGLTADPPNLGEALMGTLTAATGGLFAQLGPVIKGPAANFTKAFQSKIGTAIDESGSTMLMSAKAKLGVMVEKGQLTKEAADLRFDSVKTQFNERLGTLKGKFTSKEAGDQLTADVEAATKAAKGADMAPGALEQPEAQRALGTSMMRQQVIPMALQQTAVAANQHAATTQGTSQFKPLTDAELAADILKNVPGATVAPAAGAPASFSVTPGSTGNTIP